MLRIEMNWSDFYCKRFDFGVPLEDIFPPSDIHPRLKQLFREAYEAFLSSHSCIDDALSTFQGSLKECFKLKEQVVFRADYKCGYGNFSPGSYFWVIRHFLGLLPIPLLPKYINSVKLNWTNLAHRCKQFLYDYETYGKKNGHLDFDIAKNLTLLPFSHFVLIHVLMVFLRKVSTTFKQLHFSEKVCLNRASVCALTHYFCASIFSRPFQPGHFPQRDKMFALLFYMIVRWRDIRKHCKNIGYPVYILHSNFELAPSKILHLCNNGSQPNNFRGLEPILPVKKESCISTQTDFLINASCQTDNYIPLLQSTAITVDHVVLTQNKDDKDFEDDKSRNSEIAKNYKLTYFKDGSVGDEDEAVEENEENDKEKNHSTCVGEEIDSIVCEHERIDENEKNDGATYFGKEIVDVKDENPFFKNPSKSDDPPSNDSVEDQCDNSLFQTAVDNTFSSSLLSKSMETGNWKDVLQETVQTVRKVEEYIYDDYETFEKEEYNQILNNKSKRASLLEKMSKFGWTYTPPKNVANEITDSKKSTPSDDNSYTKYPDVFEEEHLENQSSSDDKADNNLSQPVEVTSNKKVSTLTLTAKPCTGRENAKTLPMSNARTVTSNLFNSTPVAHQFDEIQPVFTEDNIERSYGDNCQVKRKKRQFNLGKFKMRFRFLRALTPRKNSTLSRVISNVKYQRIKQDFLTGSHTL